MSGREPVAGGAFLPGEPAYPAASDRSTRRTIGTITTDAAGPGTRNPDAATPGRRPRVTYSERLSRRPISVSSRNTNEAEAFRPSSGSVYASMRSTPSVAVAGTVQSISTPTSSQ